jgi:hypothetical protein
MLNVGLGMAIPHYQAIGLAQQPLVTFILIGHGPSTMVYRPTTNQQTLFSDPHHACISN